ncbi:MAG: HNH endonuclease [Dehalococcoidia bacterium]|nr:HNH endonuclease [Dehalococcoidia bacterium]
MAEETTNRRKAIPQAVKMTVWKKYFGADKAQAPCCVCQKTIRITDFDCAHVISKANGGSDDTTNLRPTCGGCNEAMRARNLEDYKAEYYSVHKGTSSSPKS